MPMAVKATIKELEPYAKQETITTYPKGMYKKTLSKNLKKAHNGEIKPAKKKKVSKKKGSPKTTTKRKTASKAKAKK